MQRLGEPLLQRPDDEAAHEAGVAKAHFRLGGMDVDVDLARVAFDEQRQDRVPVGRQEIHVGRPHRAGEILVAHGPAVDEDELRERVRPAEGRHADPSLEPHALARRLDAQRVLGEVASQRLPQALRPARFAGAAGRPVEGSADIARKGEARRGMAERQALDDVGDRLRFAPVGFEELEPRRRRSEQVARLDPRADSPGAGLDRALRPVLDDEPQARRSALRPGADLQPGDGGDRGQRLAAEAEGGDRSQVAVGDFRGRMPLDREREVGFVHAAPVVGHADEAPAARLDRDLDRPRAGVESVLDQFLGGRGRPLDHLAGGDAIDEQGIEAANSHGRSRRSYRTASRAGPRLRARFFRSARRARRSARRSET